MHMIWKEFAKNHPGKFDKELKIKTDFAVRTLIFVARFISFIIYSCKYLIISYLLKCMRQKQGTNLCAYYIFEVLHFCRFLTNFGA